MSVIADMIKQAYDDGYVARDKEIVRCGECKYYSKYRCPNDMMLWTHICALGCGTCGEDWFCADGERKEKTDAVD